MPVVRKIRCRLADIIPHGDHVYTLSLVPESPTPRFLPGQFLHLAIDEYDASGFWPDSRVFSIASSPEEKDRIEIHYSVQGRFTTRMEEELKIDSVVWVKMPYGEFIIQPGKDIALFAGGTGVSAFTAFLYRLSDCQANQVNLFYGARTLALLAHRERLEDLAARIHQLHTTYFVEQNGEAASQTKAKNVCVGRLSVDAALPSLRDPMNTDYYLSGPPAMLSALRTALYRKGIAETAVHIDAW